MLSETILFSQAKHNLWVLIRTNLLAKLEFEDLNLILREGRLPWCGHVERSGGAVRTACDIQIDGRQGERRPKLTWKKLTVKE